MFTDEQLNQLATLLAPILEGQAQLQVGQQQLQVGQRELQAELRSHVKQSQEEHEELAKAIIEVGDTLHGQLEHHDKRLTRIEKRLDLPPLE